MDGVVSNGLASITSNAQLAQTEFTKASNAIGRATALLASHAGTEPMKPIGLALSAAEITDLETALAMAAQAWVKGLTAIRQLETENQATRNAVKLAGG